MDELVQLIWNYSVRLYTSIDDQNYLINLYLGYEETKVYNTKEMLKDILCSENIFKSMTPGCISIIELMDKNDDKNLRDQILYTMNENSFNTCIPQNLSCNFDFLREIYLSYKITYPLNIANLLDFVKKELDIDYISSIPGLKRLIWINNFIKNHKFEIDSFTLFDDLDCIYNMGEKYREKESVRFPEKLLIIVEGATEEKLLPVFSEKMGVDFYKTGVQLIAAGGKNQVIRIYKEIYKKLSIPILVILDADAQNIAEEIKPVLSEKDRIFILPEGEFEDILPVDLILKAVNKFYRLTTNINKDEIDLVSPRVEALSNLWKEKGLGEFDKVAFAKIIAENVIDIGDFSPSIKKIISLIKEMIFI